MEGNEMSAVFGKRYAWTPPQDKQLWQIMEDGGNYVTAARILKIVKTACELRHIKLKAEKQARNEKPVVTKSINYLRSRDFITFQDGEEFVVGNTRMTEKQLIAKAKQVKVNTEILARAAQ